MDSVNLSAVTPRRSLWARAFLKVFRARAAAGVSPDDDGMQKVICNEKVKNDRIKTAKIEDERITREAFMAKIFASLSSIKAAYAQLQNAQSPYDADRIQSADQTIVSELKNLSELKRCYFNGELHEPSPETALLVYERHEQSSHVKIYEVTCRKMHSQIRLKESEIVFLKEKLAEMNSDFRLLTRLDSSGELGFSPPKPSNFIAFLREVVESIRIFVRLLIDEMNSDDWDLVAAASSIHPGVTFWKENHACFAFESYVSGEMFDSFSPDTSDRRREISDGFMELQSMSPADYLVLKPKSKFAAFCRSKYLRVIHPKMEESFFGNLEQRTSVSSGELPETPFFAAFVEMARRIWLLRCLAAAFDPPASVFRVDDGSRFSEVYMESVSDDVFDTEYEPRVAFTVAPGFRLDKIVVQSRVYLN